jgi:MerR family transcriptional regulator/heat shock protein HspR
MDKELWTITEVIESFEIEEQFVRDLEEEEIICTVCGEDPGSKLFQVSELEKLRLAKILFDDMGVNLEGIDIILRMRQNMIDMRRQFDDILEDVANRMKQAFEEKD